MHVSGDGFGDPPPLPLAEALLQFAEGVLPGALGRIHPRHRSPYAAGIAQTVLGAVVVLAFWAAGADPYGYRSAEAW